MRKRVAQTDLLVGRTQEARDIYAALVGAKPDDPERGLPWRAEVLLGNLAEARKQLEKAATQSPEHVVVRAELAKVASQLKDVAAAEAHVSRLLELAPMVDATHLAAGDVALRHGDYARAHIHYVKAYSIKETDLAMSRLAKVHVRIGDVETAIQLLTGFLTASENHEMTSSPTST